MRVIVIGQDEESAKQMKKDILALGSLYPEIFDSKIKLRWISRGKIVCLYDEES